LPFCNNCGTQYTEGTKFCGNCGAQTIFGQSQVIQKTNQATPNPPPVQTTTPQTEKEQAYFRGKGELIIKKTEHRGAGRKAASWLALGPVGYVAFGRDKTRKSKSKGELVVTNKAIYVAGNDYPFDRLLALTRSGKKEVEFTFESGVKAGGRVEGGILGVGGMSVEAMIKMDSREECDQLFDALQRAKLSHVSF
jgi:hypothetical protein